MTLDEWFPMGRGDGRKFRNKDWPEGESPAWFEPIFRDTVRWRGLDNIGCSFSSCPDSGDWVEWVPPKKTVKIKFYREIIREELTPLVTNSPDHTYHLAPWSSVKKSTATSKARFKTVGWREMEVEVEE